MKIVAVLLAGLAFPLAAHAGEPVATAFAPTLENSSKTPAPAPEGMVWISGGEFSMGADGMVNGASCCSPGTVADTLPIHRVAVDGFWMDAPR